MNPISSILYCGHMKKEKDNHMVYRPTGSGDYFFLYFPEGIYASVNGGEVLLKKNACVFYGPDDYQCFRGTPSYISSYIHFHAPAYIRKLNIPFSQPFYPHNYEILNQLVLEMQNESMTKDPFSPFLADLALQKLLHIAARDFYTGSSREAHNRELYQRFENFRIEMISSCAFPWTVEQMAKRMAMSRSRFYDYYKHFFQISPKADLIQARIQKATSLLTNEAMSVSEVALESGFENVSHFTRYFKKHYGHPPREYADYNIKSQFRKP